MLHAIASYNIVIRVFNPDSSPLAAANNRLSNITLPVTGTYTVEISAVSSSSSGSFDLYYLRGDDSISGGSLTSGQVQSGFLDPNAIDSYQISVMAGQDVMLFASSDYVPVIRIFRPDGSFLTWNNSRIINVAFPDTGTYTVAVYGNIAASSGSYNLYYLRGADSISGGSLTSGLTRNGFLDTNGIDSYQISGTAGQNLMLHASAAYVVALRIFNPDGTVMIWGTSRLINVTLPETGTYTVAVYGNITTSNGPYHVYYLRGDDSVARGTLLSSIERSGQLPHNGLESYKFTGSAGNPLTVNTTGTFTRAIRIYGPDGTLWTSANNAMSRTLPETGEYSLVIYGTTAPISGSYTVTLTTPPLPPVPSDPTKSGVNALDACLAGSSPSELVGNPINFDLGYKIQTEQDYSGDLLSLTRIYRSDSTWTDNTFGERWRHNYARTLDINGSIADITDGTGTITHYTLSGSDWVANDSDITARFETITGGYAYILPENTREIYDNNRRLVRIEYLGGGAVDLEYDGSGLLETVTDENDRVLTFNYTGGRVTSVVTPGGTFNYDYDGAGNLTEVEKPDNTTREYHYEDMNFPHALTGITDENAVRYATWAYDTQGRAILSKLAGDVDSFEITYNPDGSVTTTNPLGKDTTYHFTNINGLRRIVQVEGHASPNCTAANQYYNYYSNGWLMGKTDWEGNNTTYTRERRGLVTQIVEADGTDEQRITNTAYDNDFSLPTIMTVGNRQTEFDYDDYGRVESVAVTDLDTTETRTTTYTYYPNTTDPNGNLVLGRVETITHPNDAETRYTYNGDLMVETVTRAFGESYAQETAYTYDAARRIETITEPGGMVTALTYDTLGRLESTTQAEGTALEGTTTYTYDNIGNVTSITLPNGVTLSYEYDNTQRLTGVEDSLGNTIAYTLDDAGNILTEEYHDSTPTLRYTHSRAYDELSRMIESIGAASQTSLYAYDNNGDLISFTDANAGETDYAYDGLQRLVRATDALSGETDFTYDVFDNTKIVNDARDNDTEYLHNAFGEVVEEFSPDRGTVFYSYDAAGNLTMRTDARGNMAQYNYDLLNRITAVEYPTDSGNDVTLSYDSCPNGQGLLCSVTDASGVTDYEYDLLGRVTKVTETRGLLDFVTAYDYDLAGNITEITLPSGRTITYGLNANGQVSSVTATIAGSPVALASSITYLPFGPMSGLTYGNSLTFTAGFDQDYNPTSRAVSGIFSHVYDTDPVGNIIERGPVTYDYDALNRLTEEDDSSTVTYTYDATSNRLTRVNGGTTTITVPATSNKISAVGSDSYSYDAAGNIIDDGTREYIWDDAGRLAEVQISSSTVGEYIYNASNQRAIKDASSTVTHYVYGAGGLLYGEYDSSGNLVREYVYLNQEPLAQIDAGSPEVLTYLHTDNLGTPRFATNTGGSQVWTWTSDAFGIGAPTGSVTVNLRMPGQYFDAESNLFYNWNRYYNPEIGRYISSDPIGLEGGINTFLYAEANPLLYSDPEGLQTIPWPTTAFPFTPIPALGPMAAPVAVGSAALGTGIAAGYYGTEFLFNCFFNESAGDSVEQCKQKCDAAMEDGVKLCNMLKTKSAREKCYSQNNEIYARCLRNCE